MITDVDKKQALVVTLSLSGKARETALEIDSSEVNADDGMDVLIKQLDVVFKKEAIDEAYSLFESYKRKPEETVSDYIIEFEHRYRKKQRNLRWLCEMLCWLISYYKGRGFHKKRGSWF